jgi:hypothetical protein
MKLFNMGNGMNIGTGLLVGAAVVLVGPMLLTAAGGALKSLTKAGIKGGLMAYEQGKAAVNNTKGALTDLTKEAKAELKK